MIVPLTAPVRGIGRRLRRRARTLARRRPPMLRWPRGERAVFIARRGRASRRTRQAVRALEAGRTTEAAALAVRAIVAAPGNPAAFRVLGAVLAAQGLNEQAMQCLRGELPDAVFERYVAPLSSRPGGAPAGPLAGPPRPPRRTPLGGGEHVAATRPPNLPAHIAQAFPTRGIVAAPRLVDRIDGGHVWQDACDTVVFDRGGCVLPTHSIGNARLVAHLAASHEPVALGRRAVVLGARSSGNYYHWLTDVLPKLELCRLAGVELAPDDRVVLPFRRTRFQLETLALYGIEERQVHYATRESPYVRADELIVPRLGNAMGTRMGTWLPAALARRVLGEDDARPDGERRLFVARNPARSQGRDVANIDEIGAWFATRGFEVVLPETLSVAEQARLFATASVIAAPHGAGLANLVFCRPGTRVIEFFGAHLAPCYWAIGALAGLDYRACACRNEERGVPSPEAARACTSTLDARREAGFVIDVERAARALAAAGVD